MVQSPTDNGFVLGIYGAQQVGQLNGHASLWSGTAASRIDLGVGTAEAIWGDEQVGRVDGAALWHGSAASFVDLRPAGTLDSEAFAVAGGQQGGHAWFPGPFGTRLEHAALWSGSAASFVDLNPPGATGSVIKGMWPGQQVGLFGSQTFSSHAAMWSGSAGFVIDLAPPNSGYSGALGTCGTAQVGYAGLASGNNAVIWFGSAASIIDLGQFLPAGQYFQSQALAVSFYNGQYYVAGQATRSIDHVPEAWLWVGVPAPGAGITLLVAGLWAARRRR